jgi:hypothetical protein
MQALYVNLTVNDIPIFQGFLLSYRTNVTFDARCTRYPDRSTCVQRMSMAGFAVIRLGAW